MSRVDPRAKTNRGSRGRANIATSSWLRRRDKIYLGALFDRGPHMYWMRDEETAALFESAGFRVLGAGTDAQIATGALAYSVASLARLPVGGRLYFACRKPE